jgi:hypothetical protein
MVGDLLNKSVTPVRTEVLHPPRRAAPAEYCISGKWLDLRGEPVNIPGAESKYFHPQGDAAPSANAASPFSLIWCVLPYGDFRLVPRPWRSAALPARRRRGISSRCRHLDRGRCRLGIASSDAAADPGINLGLNPAGRSRCRMDGPGKRIGVGPSIHGRVQAAGRPKLGLFEHILSCK